MEFAIKEQTPVIYSAGATKAVTFTFAKGRQCISMHWHDRIEILLVKKGELEYILGSKKDVLKEGQALIIPPKMAHFGIAKTDVTYDVLMFDLRYFYNDTDVCKNTLSAIFEGSCSFDSKTENPVIIECIDSICHTDLPGSLRTVAKVYNLLHNMIYYGIITMQKTVCKNGVAEIVEYIEKEYTKDLSAGSLCKKFGYTQAHFCRKFKNATGLSPVTYLKIYRLEKAFDLIKNTDLQICEIANMCGFSDSNYFTRCFTAHYQNPPTHYRKV